MVRLKQSWALLVDELTAIPNVDELGEEGSGVVIGIAVVVLFLVLDAPLPLLRTLSLLWSSCFLGVLVSVLDDIDEFA